MRYRVTIDVEVWATDETAAMVTVASLVERDLAVLASDVADCEEVDETPSDAQMAAQDDQPSAAERRELAARDAWGFR